ncbi:hypothetical protein [Azospirillum brasilense]|uniref:hypothetical protein n=1 Tax=Azospirillum brasilense TaxID=192 RepID=UPI001FFFE53C|nr:hypothetical protein [Azospirillum brasilense]
MSLLNDLRLLLRPPVGEQAGGIARPPDVLVAFLKQKDDDQTHHRKKGEQDEGLEACAKPNARPEGLDAP